MKRAVVVTVLVAALAALVALDACKPDVCPPGVAYGAHPLARSPINGAHAFTHAHNDYEHTHPLFDALDARFYSVEADVWFRDDTIKVSHDGIDFKGTLDDLYLNPLEQRVAKSGSVYGDGAPFTLWIDIKEGSQQLQDALAAKLSSHAMFTRFFDDHVDERAVRVILTGDGAKRALANRAQPRAWTRDDNDFHVDDPHADTRWTSYALSWGDNIAWDGHGPISEADKQRFVCIVDGAHDKGRSVRMFATPETPEYWQVALDVGEDFINTDNLVGLSRFLDTH